jgi:heavy metal translocating P-type ATPase
MTCTLCDLPTTNTSGFCCPGCENVHAILVESGAVAPGQSFRDTDLFREALKRGLVSNPSAEAPPPPDAETREAVFHVSGMWCASCGWLIEHALARIRGIVSAEVLFASDLLKVRYCPQYLPKQRIADAVGSLGYRAAEYTGSSAPADAERRDLLLRTGIAAFLSMNVMTFSLVVYASYFEHITSSFARYIPFLLMALATPSVFWCAAPVLRLAWGSLRAGVLRMESLLAMGILMAYGYSAVQAFRGNPHVYFDTACAIVTLVLTGKTIERGAKDRTRRAITLLHGLMPNKARILQDGRERFISLEALQPDMIFLVKPGERIAADGVVVEGRSHADESVLTGESAPVPKTPGSHVVCGSVNTGSPLQVRATRVGVDSTLAHIVRTVEQATAGRTRMERAVDRLSRMFIPVVLMLSALTFAGWQWRTGRPADALMHALAVIVIACPCALGIATPMALTSAVAGAARRGILVSDTRVLETIRAVDVVVLDKTGTATEGRFELLEITGDTSRMAELAAIEAYSEHPIARAIVAYVGRPPAPAEAGSSPMRVPTACAVGYPLSAPAGLTVHPGRGITATVGGTEYFIGNATLAGSETPSGPHTTVYFGWDGLVRGTMTLGDRVRPRARGLCANLRWRGIHTVLLSGDSVEATRHVAEEIGADEWIAEALPDRKVEVIRELQRNGAVVAMIGDGVNDAASLARADLGIAVGSGADIALQAAPLVLMNRSLEAVAEALELAKRAFSIIHQNLFWAFAYNVIGITLAMSGVLSPIFAAAAMVLSSISVLGNSRRLRH